MKVSGRIAGCAIAVRIDGELLQQAAPKRRKENDCHSGPAYPHFSEVSCNKHSASAATDTTYAYTIPPSIACMLLSPLACSPAAASSRHLQPPFSLFSASALHTQCIFTPAQCCVRTAYVPSLLLCNSIASAALYAALYAAK